MGVKKYTAATMQKALKNIREDLGDDAIILSNRKLPNGHVEIAVSLEDSDANTVSASKQTALVAQQQEPNRYGSGPSVEPLSLSNEKAKQLLAAVRTNQQAQQSFDHSQMNTQQADPRDFKGHLTRAHIEANSQQLNLGAGPLSHGAHSQPGSDITTLLQHTMLQLQQEILELRKTVHESGGSQSELVSEPVAPEPAQEKKVSIDRRALALVTKKWRQVGLDDALLKEFQKTALFQGIETASEQQLWKGCLKHLKSGIPRYSRNAIETPGVYAFVGPTGAGKTTTLGKLAVRQVNRWGAENVGIVTMDSFRIGAWEQMQRLGDIIGVKTALCRQEDSLLDTLSQMRNCRFILVDTAGLSHQDDRRLAQWQKLQELGDELETYLVAPANLQTNVLYQLTQAYESARVRGMVFTKCDEVTSLGEAVSALVKAELPWVFACDGQRIPEDLKVMSVDSVMQMLATTTKQKRWDLGGHASEQETILVNALG